MQPLTEDYICQIRADFTNGKAAEQKELLSSFGEFIALVDWESVASHSGDFAVLLHDLVDCCAPTVGRPLHSVLKLGVDRYSNEISSQELTCLHCALAAHCLKFNLLEPDDVSRLHCLPARSQDIAPPSSIADIAQYFESCAMIRSKLGEWSDAAIHSALSLFIMPSMERYRWWYLAELIANVELTMLPRPVWPNLSCPVMAELGRLFEKKSRTAWLEILTFCETHYPEFERWGLKDMLRRAQAAYVVHWIAQLALNVSVAPVSLLLDPVLNSGITLNELINAGLRNHFKIIDDTLVACMEASPNAGAAGETLQDVAHLSSSLQSEIYDNSSS